MELDPTGQDSSNSCGESSTAAGASVLFAQRDRIGRVKYLQVGAGLSYDVGPADIFAAVSSYVWGRDAHDGEVYTVGATWYFDFSK